MPLVANIERSDQSDRVDDKGIPRHARDGRPKIWDEDQGGVEDWSKRKGTYYSRTTTWIDILDDRTLLGKWKARMVLKGVTIEPSILADFASLEDPFGEDREAGDRLAERARTVADEDFKADIGTGLHSIVERIIKGQGVGFVPDEYADDIAAFLEAVERSGIEFLGSEVFGVNDTWKIAGTLDFLVRMPDGEVVVGDLKTGRMDYSRGKVLRQIAAYSGYRRYDPATCKRTDLIPGHSLSQERGLLVEVPAGKAVCRLVQVDVAQGHRDLALCEEVREYRRRVNRKAIANPPVWIETGKGLQSAG